MENILLLKDCEPVEDGLKKVEPLLKRDIGAGVVVEKEVVAELEFGFSRLGKEPDGTLLNVAADVCGDVFIIKLVGVLVDRLNDGKFVPPIFVFGVLFDEKFGIGSILGRLLACNKFTPAYYFLYYI